MCFGMYVYVYFFTSFELFENYDFCFIHLCITKPEYHADPIIMIKYTKWVELNEFNWFQLSLTFSSEVRKLSTLDSYTC